MDNTDKHKLRNDYQSQRSQMSQQTTALLSTQICRHILQWKQYQTAETVFFYYPLGNEVSLLPVVKDAFASGKRTAFPKVSGSHMDFYETLDLADFKEGSFHVMEPCTGKKIPADFQPVLCFVPGSVFDRQGGRLGYGKGYYDRYFVHNSQALLVGCAYEFQIVPMLPTDAWDIRMDYLLSENGIVEIQ